IARATVRMLLARRLRTIVLAGRDPAGLERAAAEARALGATTVETVAFDARDTASHPAIVEGAFARHDGIDLVLLAFGVLGDQETCEKDANAAVEVLTVNFVGAASAGLASARQLRAQGHGVLAVLSSVAGERARRANFVYGSSKAGLDAFFQGLGDALAGSGARVLVVRPGFVRTRMTAGLPTAPFATTADEVAAVIVRALGTGAEVVWAPPRLRWVMAAVRHLPRPLFRKLRT
ncbi:MAG TPA: decaprenylphospho-beta-D-erythro-pentofuranosid-2-ulose 2-reductase, partial [Acidimicrobiales bacterium]|nr:decaprenylphospho-beta-D-erythro-pentofuranosid-2-ulose 2-reductase [Acidimicrobiales bacterium]